MTNIKTFTDRSNCRKAAKREAGDFTIRKLGDRAFAFWPLTIRAADGITVATLANPDDPATEPMRWTITYDGEELDEGIEAAADDLWSAEQIASHAEAIGRRHAREKERAEAAAEAEPKAAEPGAAEAEAPASDAGEALSREMKKRAKLPKEGTKTRIMLDMMRRPEGTTRPEIVEAGGIDVSLVGFQREWAERYGLKAETTKEGRQTRYFLRG